jgi:membrane-associated phospholipid phosphatase
MDTLHRLDDRLFTNVNDLARHTGWLHGAVLAYAGYGVVLFAALLLAGLWLRRADTDRALAAAGWAPLAVLLALGLNQPLVSAFAEARPYTSHPGVLVLASHSSDFSFPSDHAVMAGAATAGLWLVSRALGALAAVAALVMAFSRVYIAAHYPWDVAVGLLFGALVALLGWVPVRALLTVVTGWLRARPGLRHAFPVPHALPAKEALPAKQEPTERGAAEA